MKSSALNKKLELWEMSDTENDLGETSREAVKVKDIWCQVVPKHGSTQEIGDTGMEEARVNLKIKCRKLSVSDPSIDMFFLNGSLRYEILDWFEDFKDNSFYEFSCRVVYE